MSITTYKAPPSLEGFLTSDAFIALCSGPVGSGKSSAAMLKIAYHAKQMKAGADGLRRSRAVVVRNTAEMLRDSTIPTFTTWFPEGQAGTLARTDKRFFLEFDDVRCEILFRGLDDSNDVRRLLSLEVSFGVLDEYREIHPDIFNALQGRVGRYPSRANGGCVKDDGYPNAHVWGATNAPDSDTFWETYMDDPPKNAEIFKQPSALSQEADWLDNLIEGYYDNLAEGKTQDWVDVYIHNQFGKSLAGRPVFSSFKTETHVAKAPLIIQSAPLIIGVDAGLTPTATICQVDYQGRLLVHSSISGESMGALRFCREMLKPLLANKFGGKPSIIVIDPAAFQRAQTDERTVADIFKNEGFHVKPAITNTITARLAAVDGYLTRTVDTKPAILIDPSCKDLIMAMRSKYRYKVSNKGEVDNTPEKSHPWSDYCDSLQYAALHADGGASHGAKRTSVRKEIKKASYVYA